MRQLRSLVFGIWFLLTTFVIVIIGVGVGAVAPGVLRHYARIWTRTICLGLPLAGIRYKVSGRENLPKSGPMLIVSQHQSAFETMIWFLLVPDARYVMKMELMEMPLFGWIAKRFGQIGVVRGAGAQSMRSLLRDSAAAWKQGGQIVIFPEGTRATPGEPINLKVGFTALAGLSDHPVIPVTTDSGVCWGKGMFGKRAGIIHVDIHPALPSGLSRNELMQRVQSLYEESNRAAVAK